VIVTARGLTGGVSLRTVVDALVAGFGADEVGHCLGVLGRVGGDAIAADARVVKSILGCIGDNSGGVTNGETYSIAGVD
jgi:hypothetical protein